MTKLLPSTSPTTKSTDLVLCRLLPDRSTTVSPAGLRPSDITLSTREDLKQYIVLRVFLVPWSRLS